MNAIILAAGDGRRFWPYGEVRNKCAFPIANVPAVRRLAEQLLAAGIEGVTVVLGARAGSVRAALAGLEEHLHYVEQPGREGTADAALLAVGSAADEPFVVVYGDVVTTEETLRAVVAAARKGDAPAAAVVQPLGRELPGDWITARVQAGSLDEFHGHGRPGHEGTQRLCGLYALQPAAMRYLRTNPGIMTHVAVGAMPPPEAEVAESLALMVDDGLPVAAIEAAGFLVDLDKPWHILEANRLVLEELATRTPKSRIADGAEIAESAEVHGKVVLAPGARIGERVVVKGDLWLGPGAEVTNGAIVGPGSMLGAGAKVRDYALLGGGTVLGPKSLCGHGAEFEGTLLDGAYLYHYCEVYGVLGAQVDIGAATVCGTLRFDDGVTTHVVQGRRERPLSGANASYLGDYSRTGVNAILMPGVKVGVYSCVGAGVVLYEDLPSREMVLVKQELERRPWGPERYGW